MSLSEARLHWLAEPRCWRDGRGRQNPATILDAATCERNDVGVKLLIAASAGAAVVLVSGCTNGGSDGGRPTLPTSRATQTAGQTSTVTVGGCRSAPPTARQFVRGRPRRLLSFADVIVRPAGGASFELVGIYVGNARTVLLIASHHGRHFVALDRYSRQVTGLPRGEAPVPVAGTQIEQRLRLCFGS
jgi:hypothetical protein